MKIEQSSTSKRSFLKRAVAVGVGSLAGIFLAGSGLQPAAPDEFVVLANNDLGMHCMMRDFSHFMILPPFNTVQAVVIKRGDGPDVIDIAEGSDFTLEYSVPGNTHSATKSNFWKYDQDLLGVDLQPDIGLTGNGMSGTMTPHVDKWEVTGIPITPIDDAGRVNPYQLATVTVHKEGTGMVAQTQTVLPVSFELSCNVCHGDPVTGTNVEVDVLRDHDRLHGTNLEMNQPVFCAGCHADPALGAPGEPGLPTFSSAMHSSHADRLLDLPSTFDNACYACHPGRRAQCQRDIHSSVGMDCVSCHGGMADVGDPSRVPWVDEPKCGDCHDRAGFDFEQPGTLYRNSIGHGGVACFACHGSPHAITPATTETDNLQAVLHQGVPGVISDCSVCHTQTPDEPFFHRVED